MNSIKKTLLASAAFLVMAAPAFAFVPAPAPLGDSAYITQVGDKNIADVDQKAGDVKNVARINQGTARDHATEEKAFVKQSGRGGNSSLVNQTGKNDVAQVDQKGSNGSATVTQSGSGRHDGRNLAIIEQGRESRNEQASIEQDGGRNFGLIDQKGSDDKATIKQKGHDNKATVRQDDSFGATALVTQTGDDNTARVDQSGHRAYAEVSQTGNNNHASVDQDASHRSGRR